jgi:hypothetical protein
MGFDFRFPQAQAFCFLPDEISFFRRKRLMLCLVSSIGVRTSPVLAGLKMLRQSHFQRHILASRKLPQQEITPRSAHRPTSGHCIDAPPPPS